MAGGMNRSTDHGMGNSFVGSMNGGANGSMASGFRDMNAGRMNAGGMNAGGTSGVMNAGGISGGMSARPGHIGGLPGRDARDLSGAGKTSNGLCSSRYILAES